MTPKSSCIVFFLFLYSLAFSQTALEDRNISLQLNEASLIEVIKAIEAQSGVSFVYNTTVMKNAQKICLNVEDADLKILLQTICSESGNNYKVINNQIVFFKVAAPSEETIKILIEPKTEKRKVSSSSPLHDSISKTIISSVNTISDSNSLTDTNTIKPPDSSISVNTDTLNTVLPRNKSKVQIVSLPAQIVPHKYTPDSLILSDLVNNIPDLDNTKGKKKLYKYFYSIQVNSLLCIDPGFLIGDSLNAKETRILNKNVNNYCFSGAINIGYSFNRLSFKMGMNYMHVNEELSLKEICHNFSKETIWRVVTWQELSPDGIAIHTDTVPITQTIVNDSIVAFTKKYSYSYLEIPFSIDYTIPFNTKWSVFGSLGITYAITLKENSSASISVYEPKAVNNLNVSTEASVGLKFGSNRLYYYFLVGGKVRTSMVPNNKLISRNPTYMSLAFGIVNYF